MWACFWHSLKDLKVGVVHPRCDIGSLSASPSFSTLIKCAGGVGAKKCPEFVNWILLSCKHLARDGGHLARLPRSDKKIKTDIKNLQKSSKYDEKYGVR